MVQTTEMELCIKELMLKTELFLDGEELGILELLIGSKIFTLINEKPFNFEGFFYFKPFTTITNSPFNFLFS